MIRSSLLAMICCVYLVSCSETIDNTGTCSDGIKNQGEQETDCGGPCPNYCESCADGIRNQGETAVDCGGPCDPCFPRVSASINHVAWTSTSRNAYLTSPAALQIFGTGPGGSVTLRYSGPFAPGSMPAGNRFAGEFRDESGRTFSSGSSGRIKFTTFDTTRRTVSGIYEFTGADPITGAQRLVTQGVFTEMEY